MPLISIFKSANIFIWTILTILTLPTLYSIITDAVYLFEWCLLPLSCSPINLTLIADKTGLMFAIVVLFISTNVLSFSKLYMSEDKFKNRFTVLVLLFVLSINILIFLPHFIILLLGWDGLGLVSFILVMYYQNPNSLAAAILTALTNRIGDVAILLAIAITINQGHWLIINIHTSHWIVFQIILITLAAMTKRAQIPFSSWLPAAMAAPTPVSALVHSSTLVTAGVFLLIRFYPFLHQLPWFHPFILFIATSTTLIAGLRANTECDFKKIVALSTLSQLGIIIFSIGLGIPWLAYFHIVTHALFKALLFVCVGSFINFHAHSQDLRWMGNITRQIPIITSCLIISNIALCGFPFLAGFYSKDIIIEYMLHSTISETLIELSLFRLGLTTFYSIRATIVGVLAPKLINPYISISEPKEISSAAALLAVAATIIGATVRWIYPVFTHITFICFTGKNIPIIYIILGFGARWIYSTIKPTTPSPLIIKSMLHQASCTIWFLVPISTQLTLKAPISIAHLSLKSIDQGWTEQISGQGILTIILKTSNNTIQNSPHAPNTLIMSCVIFTILIVSIIICFNSLKKALHWSWNDDCILKHVCMV